MPSNMKNIPFNDGDRIIFNGKTYKVMERKDLSYSLPQLGFALSRYIKMITFRKIIPVIEDFEAKPNYVDIRFKGLVQPLRYCDLMLKPEEQRSWTWLKVTTFSLQGSMHYHLVQDYERTDGHHCRN